MKYYLDTEFNGFGGELISLALVGEDNKGLYLVHELDEYEPWVKENVVPYLYKSPILPTHVIRKDWGRAISKFISRSNEVQIISDWPDDIRYFCQELIVGPGQMVKTQQVLHFAVVRVDSYPTTLKNAVRHNSYWDALALKEVLS